MGQDSASAVAISYSEVVTQCSNISFMGLGFPMSITTLETLCYPFGKLLASDESRAYREAELMLNIYMFGMKVAAAYP